jgi:hypothetical protein
MKRRSAGRALAVTATAALLLTAPGFVGSASAHDGGRGSDDSRISAPSLAPEIQSAVKTARDTYFTAARKVRDDYRAAVMAIRTAMQNQIAPQLAAAQAAKKALDDASRADADQATLDSLKSALRTSVENLRTAISTSKTAHAAEFTTAANNAKSALDAAGKAYAAAVTAAFATFAPGTPVPPGLLIPPGNGLGWSTVKSPIEGLNLDSGKGRH